jgi:hypothetical protein
MIDGVWYSSETENKITDELRYVWIVCEDTPENIDFLMYMKKSLMERFEQEEILILYTHVHRL